MRYTCALKPNGLGRQSIDILDLSFSQSFTQTVEVDDWKAGQVKAAIEADKKCPGIKPFIVFEPVVAASAAEAAKEPEAETPKVKGVPRWGRGKAKSE